MDIVGFYVWMSKPLLYSKVKLGKIRFCCRCLKSIKILIFDCIWEKAEKRMFSLQTELMFDALNLNAKSQTVFPISMIEMKYMK